MSSCWHVLWSHLMFHNLSVQTPSNSSKERGLYRTKCEKSMHMYSDQRNDPPGFSEGENPIAEKQRGNPQITSSQLWRLDSQLPQRIKGQGAEFSGIRNS